MFALIFSGTAAFVLCFALTPIFRDLCLRAGLVDKPDSDRKIHLRAVPRIGGVPIALAYLGTLGLLLYFNPLGVGTFVRNQKLFHALLPAAAIMAATGLLDDLLSLRPWQKLLGQMVAACVAVHLGIRLSILPSHPSLSFLISTVWLIGCSNAVNLIDGMDGLATGVGVLATLTTMVVALHSGNATLALATVPLLGALLAFLRYNFSPATVFLGDCGSLTIGFMLGCFGLAWNGGNTTLTGMLGPLMVLALPLLDVCLAIGRRFLRAVPIFQGDRGHIHHRVQALGFSTRGTALLLYGVCAFAAIFAIWESVSVRRLSVPIALTFVVLMLWGVRRLQYVEFSAARKMFSQTLFRGVVKDQIYLDELTAVLQLARTADEWWDAVQDTVIKLHFSSAVLHLDGTRFAQYVSDVKSNAGCRIRIGLGDRGSLELTRGEDSTSPRNMMAVLHCIQASLDDMPHHFGPQTDGAGADSAGRVRADKVNYSSAA